LRAIYHTQNMKKKKWLGSLLNLVVPGLGNIYGRKIQKGIVIFILFFIIVFGSRFIAYTYELFAFSLTLILGFYVYLIVSGYRDVEKSHVYEPTRLDKWYVYVLIILTCSVLVNLMSGHSIDKITPINFASTPTVSMNPSLRVGDKLAFKKTQAIIRNDVTIFWYPDVIKTMYIMRCIGLPGDSLRITNGTVSVNGEPLEGPQLKFRYLVTTDGTPIHSRVLKSLDIDNSDIYNMFGKNLYFLTDQQAKGLTELSFVKKVERSVMPEGEREQMIYPESETLNWNTDFYGPIYIPKKGDKVKLTALNIDVYLKSIKFENASVERDNAGLTVNGRRVTEYEFKQNYFFMMGDNRHNALDSRYWGLLPEELLIGKALYLYWGATSDRIGKKIE
jgi:signal peptidase I